MQIVQKNEISKVHINVLMFSVYRPNVFEIALTYVYNHVKQKRRYL